MDTTTTITITTETEAEHAAVVCSFERAGADYSVLRRPSTLLGRSGKIEVAEEESPEVYLFDYFVVEVNPGKPFNDLVVHTTWTDAHQHAKTLFDNNAAYVVSGVVEGEESFVIRSYDGRSIFIAPYLD